MRDDEPTYIPRGAMQPMPVFVVDFFLAPELDGSGTWGLTCSTNAVICRRTYAILN